MSRPNEPPHLSQHTEPIDHILKDLTAFLKTAAFGSPEDGVERCKDEGLPKACQDLIKALGWDDKIRGLKYNVLRIRGASSAQLKVKGSADLIPVMVWGKNPTVEGMSLAPGSITHITKDARVQVEGGSVLDLLFTVEKSSK